MMRIGCGYDLHRLVPGRRLMIGGIHIPFDKGEDAHSDGDVLIHAVIDALLGAAGLGDIGEFFPPSDLQWKNADSAALLALCMQRIRQNGWRIGNIDCVVCIEQPKMLPHRARIISRLAEVIGCAESDIFVKAKTAEKTGAVGAGDAVEAYVVALLERTSAPQ